MWGPIYTFYRGIYWIDLAGYCQLVAHLLWISRTIAIVWSTKGSHDIVPSKITSLPSFKAATNKDDAACVEYSCTCKFAKHPSSGTAPIMLPLQTWHCELAMLHSPQSHKNLAWFGEWVINWKFKHQWSLFAIAKQMSFANHVQQNSLTMVITTLLKKQYTCS